MTARPWIAVAWIAAALACSPGRGARPPEPAGPVPEAAPPPAAAPDATPLHAAQRAECGACHVSDHPSKGDAALKPCTRPPSADTGPSEVPGIVQLAELSNRYQPVAFDHAHHAKMAGMGDGCASCHHHGEPGKVQPCKECHPVAGQAEDLRKPGLKGAYHRQCVGCHREWSHSNGCGFCHLRKGGNGGDPAGATPDRNDMMGRPHPVVEAKDTSVWKTSYEDGPIVTFRHKEHVDRFGLKCVDCHRKENCSRCHRTAEAGPAEPVKRPHHEPCKACHAGAIDETCETCHDRAPKPAFSHRWPLGDQHKDLSCRACHPTGKPIAKLDTGCASCHKTFKHGWPLKSYHARLACESCHAKGKPPAKVDRACLSCHKGWARDPKGFDHRVTGQVLDATHKENAGCADCHPGRRFDRPPACSGCHDKSFPKDRPGPKGSARGTRSPEVTG